MRTYKASLFSSCVRMWRGRSALRLKVLWHTGQSTGFCGEGNIRTKSVMRSRLEAYRDAVRGRHLVIGFGMIELVLCERSEGGDKSRG